MSVQEPTTQMCVEMDCLLFFYTNQAIYATDEEKWRNRFHYFAFIVIFFVGTRKRRNGHLFPFELPGFVNISIKDMRSAEDQAAPCLKLN